MDIFKTPKQKSWYDDLITHYQLNDMRWDDLAIHRKIVLLSMYKRHNNTNDTDLAIVNLRASLRKKTDCSKSNAFRLRFAI